MVCSAWFRERLRKVSLKKENVISFIEFNIFHNIEAKIEYVLRSVHDLAVKRGIRGVLYEKRLCYSNDEQNPMRKPNTGMIDDILMKCKDTVMRGMNFSQLKGCSLMVGDASGLPGQFSDSDKVCDENAGIDYMDVITFVGK